jgi:hypothetical protein
VISGPLNTAASAIIATRGEYAAEWIGFPFTVPAETVNKGNS